MDVNCDGLGGGGDPEEVADTVGTLPSLLKPDQNINLLDPMGKCVCVRVCFECEKWVERGKGGGWLVGWLG